MSVIFDAKDSTAMNDAMVIMIRKDPDRAVEHLVFCEQYPNKKDARAYVDSVIAKIALSDKGDTLKGYFSGLEEMIRELVENHESELPADDMIHKMSIKVSFDRSVDTETNEPFGFMVAKAVAHDADGNKITGAAPRKSSGGGGTKRARVPTPDGVSNWKQHLTDNYPDKVPANGSQYSAPRILKALDDPAYLAAAAEAGIDTE